MQFRAIVCLYPSGRASLLLVTQDDNGIFQTYAIIIDSSSANSSLENFVNTPENLGCSDAEIIEKLDVTLGEEYSKDSDYEKVFLKSIKTLNISIYRANSNITSWSKLELNNASNNTVQPTPCN
jgi:hypothetical protein